MCWSSRFCHFATLADSWSVGEDCYDDDNDDDGDGDDLTDDDRWWHWWPLLGGSGWGSGRGRLRALAASPAVGHATSHLGHPVPTWVHLASLRLHLGLPACTTWMYSVAKRCSRPWVWQPLPASSCPRLSVRRPTWATTLANLGAHPGIPYLSPPPTPTPTSGGTLHLGFPIHLNALL